jgi:hypothetical protein
MFKKLVVLAAGAVFSFNASAGYVAYNLSGGLSGTIIQNDVTNRIVDFQLLTHFAKVMLPTTVAKVWPRWDLKARAS